MLQSLLGSLAIFDIGPGDVPPGNLSVFVTQWVIAIQEPSGEAVLPYRSCFDFKRVIRRKSTFASRSHPLDIIEMDYSSNYVHCSIFVKSQPGVFPSYAVCV